MILYSPIDGEVQTSIVKLHPKTIFLMTQLGGEIPLGLKTVIKDLRIFAEERGYKVQDASDSITGTDFLSKIWKMIVGCPIGIVVLSEK